MKKIICCLICCFIWIERIPAINKTVYSYHFNSIDGEQGLSQNNVKAILQDSRGFMWLGTRNRLNRYDGHSLQTFDCYDPELNKRNNSISALFEDNEHQLWVGTDKGIFLYNPVYEDFRFFNVSTAGGLQIQDWIADIQEDNDNNIWTIAPNQGIFRYNTESKQLYSYQLNEYYLSDMGAPQCIAIEPNGKVWVGTNGNGVFSYNKETDRFIQYLGDKGEDSLAGGNIFTICDYGEELLIGIHEGKLLKLNKRRNTLSEVDAPDVHYKIIRHVCCFDNRIWVGTQAGVFIIDEQKKEVKNIQKEPMARKSLSDNNIQKIYRDRENGIWVGTYFGGVNHLPEQGLNLEFYIPLTSPKSLSSSRTSEILEDKDKNIWIATENGGLNLFNPSTKEFVRIGENTPYPLSYSQVMDIKLIDNQLWAGYFKNGLDIIDLASFKVTHYPADQLGLDEASIYAIWEDKNGDIWLGNGWGIFKGNKKDMRFRRMEEFGFSYIYDIKEDAEGNIWVASMGNGVFRHNIETNTTIHYLHDPENPASLSSNSVSSIKKDRKGTMWFSTDRGGICRYNKVTGNFTSFNREQDLPDDVTHTMLEDKEGNLWLGTNKGLVIFNPETNEVEILDRKNGLPCEQFNYKSALAASDGIFYFGTLDGLIALNPVDFTHNSYIPPVHITRLTVNNQPYSPLTTGIAYTQKITLKHTQSNLGLDFVALSYTAPGANQFAYKMEGLDSEWHYLSGKQNVSYAHLPPGKYTFHVKGSNNDGLWNEEGQRLEIHILPPWWRSNLAYISYLGLFLILIYCSSGWCIRRTEKENKEKQRLFESEKEKELYSAKLEFFTAIAHEIRTPVTLINGPLEAMEEMEIKNPEIKKNLRIMGKNTNQLLNLINQLLDFRKVDSKKFKLTFSNRNISAIVKETNMQFEAITSQKKKKLQLELPEEDIIAPVDKDEFGKILNNLYTNALKYSQEHIFVQLRKEKDSFYLAINNDGEIIPQELHEKIFEPFYQLPKDKSTTSSSGIGLSLLRSLVELHNGKITLDTGNGMNRFTIEIPLHQQEVIPDTEPELLLPDETMEDSFTIPDKGQLPAVLLVEDNTEMLSFITERLKTQFTIEKASTGEMALGILQERNIDIIVSDIMMPGMDGFELCQKIKSNIQYSHIPIVLLTAKNDLASKIKGLELGAEAYIEKPFSAQFLITQLTTLLNNRKREREAFMQKPFIPLQQMGMNRADEKLMNKIIDTVHENISDSSFNVEKLAEINYRNEPFRHP